MCGTFKAHITCRMHEVTYQYLFNLFSYYVFSMVFSFYVESMNSALSHLPNQTPYTGVGIRIPKYQHMSPYSCNLESSQFFSFCFHVLPFQSRLCPLIFLINTSYISLLSGCWNLYWITIAMKVSSLLVVKMSKRILFLLLFDLIIFHPKQHHQISVYFDIDFSFMNAQTFPKTSTNLKDL